MNAKQSPPSQNPIAQTDPKAAQQKTTDQASKNLKDATQGGITTTDDMSGDKDGDNDTDDDHNQPDDLIDPDDIEGENLESDEEFLGYVNEDEDGEGDQKPLMTIEEAARAGGMNAQHVRDLRSTRDQLKAADTVLIILPQNRADQPQLPDLTVRINDYTYQIQRNVGIQVPRPVAEVLVNSGHIQASDKGLAKFTRRMNPSVKRALERAR